MRCEVEVEVEVEDQWRRCKADGERSGGWTEKRREKKKEREEKQPLGEALGARSWSDEKKARSVN